MYARAANVYRKVDLESSPKSKILDRLYLRFLKDCEDAKDGINAGKMEAKANAINHGCQIVMELVAALDHKLAPDLCGNLAALYDYVVDRMTMANMKNEPALLNEASAVMTQLREAFLEAERVR